RRLLDFHSQFPLIRGPSALVLLFICTDIGSSLYFFFLRSGDHRDLHSFPTPTLFRSRALAALLCPDGPNDVAPLVPPERPPRLADRKSTRLNSSHQIISYAVFCLKKKKQHTLRSSQQVQKKS